MIGRTKRVSAVLALLVAAAVGIVIAVGCATNPVTGKRQLSLVSSQQELQMGQQGDQAVREQYGVYPDVRLGAYVDSVGQAVAHASHRPDLAWHFTIVDDDAVNAFALPGGYIYITRGILADLGDEAQLAGVLGHEIGHVTARHSAQQETQQQLFGLGLGVASIFSQTFQRYGTLAQQGMQLLFLRYSRDHETQADQLGVDYSTKAGWDSRRMPDTYRMLGRVESQSGQSLPTFLATHPDPGNRQQRTRQLSDQATAGKSQLAIRSASYLAHVNGIVYGVDPRNGYFEGSRFFDPALAIQMDFPAGWQTSNQHATVLATEPQQHASMQVTTVDTKGVTPEAYVQQLATSGKVQGARGASERIGDAAAWVGRLAVQNSDGSAGSLIAAVIQVSPNQTFQVLGTSAAAADADESAILASARSLRPLTDPARLHPEPARLELVEAPASGQFQQMLPRLGAIGVTPQEETVINNLDLDAGVARGQTIKVVRPGHRR